MNLHDQLARDLDRTDTHLDVDHLGRVARTQGTRALRRRRGAAALGSLAVIAVVGAAFSVLPRSADGDHLAAEGGGGTPSSAPPTSDFDPAHPGATGTTDARGVDAALRWAISDQADGAYTNYSGEDGHEWYSDLEFTPTDGLGLSVVGVNVQPGMYQPRCDDDGVLDCVTTTLPNGTRVTSYDEHTVVADGTGIRRSVFVKRPDGMRIVVSETNGHDLPAGRWDITRPTPPLSVAQLTAIAEQPFWGATLPTYFLHLGDGLAPYTPISDLAGQPVTTDAPAPK